MPPGRKPKYSKEVREAYIRAVFDRDVPYTRAAQELRDGTLEAGLAPVPVSTSTARGWKEKHERDRAAATPIDESALDRITDDSIRALARETYKMVRDSNKPQFIDPKRVKEHFAAIREARSLLHTAKPKTQDPEAASTGPEDTPPLGLLEQLAAEAKPAQRRPAASDPQGIDTTPEAKQPEVAQVEQDEATTTAQGEASHVHIAASR